MQDLTGHPREHLTREYVTRLLVGPSMHVEPGLRLLSLNDEFVEDITGELFEGNVKRQNYAAIPGTCQVKISRELNWGVDRLQPYLHISDGTVGGPGATFYLGVFVLATPKYSYRNDVRVYEVTGYDKSYNLDRPVGDTWVAAQGANYLTEVTRVLTAAGEDQILIDATAQGLTLPKARVWPLIAPPNQDKKQPKSDNATYRQIANDLLTAIGYQTVWYDELGRARSGPFVSPAARASEFVFDADSDDRIVGEDVEVTTDRWRAHNAWKFIRKNMPEGQFASDGAGIYEYINQSTGPTSVDKVGQRNYRVEFLDAESQSALVAAGNRIVDADRRVETVISTNTGPFPALSHMDVFTYKDLRHNPPSAKILARSWTIDLGSADTTHQWEEVV